MSRSAFLVIDAQNGFCHPRGSSARSNRPLTGVAEAVSGMAAMVAAARGTDTPFVFTRHAYRPRHVDVGRNLRKRPGDVVATAGLLADTWDAEIVRELGWSPDELTVDKIRFDAFLWTSLDPLLAALGVDHLYVGGVVTNICVESTVRSAYMRDFEVTVLSDACAAPTARLHEMSLQVMQECGFAEVARVSDLPELIADRKRLPA